MNLVVGAQTICIIITAEQATVPTTCDVGRAGKQADSVLGEREFLSELCLNVIAYAACSSSTSSQRSTTFVPESSLALGRFIVCLPVLGIV